MAIYFDIKRSGSDYHAQPTGEAKFFVGRSVHFTSGGLERVGLYNVPLSATPKVYYDAADFPALGFWAEFLAPTAMCEGRGNFVTLNTYDRAAFTWGFGQFGAHVPNGDFVRWFRGMLSRAEKDDYFPDLVVDQGRIARRSNGTSTPLESDRSTQPLMDYLNPSPTGVDDDEVVAAAKLIHWTVTHAGAREAQVSEMRQLFGAKQWSRAKGDFV